MRPPACWSPRRPRCGRSWRPPGSRSNASSTSAMRSARRPWARPSRPPTCVRSASCWRRRAPRCGARATSKRPRCTRCARRSSRCRRSPHASRARSANGATCSTVRRRRSRGCGVKSPARKTKRANAPPPCCAPAASRASCKTRSSRCATAATSCRSRRSSAGSSPASCTIRPRAGRRCSSNRWPRSTPTTGCARCGCRKNTKWPGSSPNSRSWSARKPPRSSATLRCTLRSTRSPRKRAWPKRCARSRPRSPKLPTSTSSKGAIRCWATARCRSRCGSTAGNA